MNLSFKQRVYFSNTILFLFFFILFAFIYYLLSKISKLDENLSNKILPITYNISEIQEKASLNEILSLRHFTINSVDEKKDIEQKMQINSENIDKIFVKLKNDLSSLSEDDFINKFDDNRKNLRQVRKTIFIKSHENKSAEASFIYKEKSQKIFDDMINLLTQKRNFYSDKIVNMQKEMDDYNSYITKSSVIMMIITFLFTIIYVYTSLKKILAPIKLASEIAESGDLSNHIKLSGTDEIARLCIAFDNMLDRLNKKAQEISLLSKGDLVQNIDQQGEKDELGKSFKQMIEELNTVFTSIKTSMLEVSMSTLTVNSLSINLSESTSEQAASLEEISSTMTEIGTQTQQNAKNASTASSVTNSVEELVKKGLIQMRDTLAAMKDIHIYSNQISKIIKVIDEIAFQTNLLALNAAVEAARAGTHGKGFAVVAAEVRNLAGKSAKSVKETSEIISTSLLKVENGLNLAQETANTFANLSIKAEQISAVAAEIANASEEQAKGIQQVLLGIQQIDKVTQQNAATSQTLASSSEQLDKNITTLDSLLAHFKIKENIKRSSHKEDKKNADNKVKRSSVIEKMTTMTDAPFLKKQKYDTSTNLVFEPILPNNNHNNTNNAYEYEHKKENENNPASIIALDDEEFGRYGGR